MPRVTIESAGERAYADYTLPTTPTHGPLVMPGPSNTGVPRGTVLKRHDGDMVVTAPGAVIDGIDLYGNLTVKAKDVTVRRSILRGGQPGRQVGIVQCAGDGYSLTLEDSEVAAQFPSYQVDGIRGWNLTMRRLNVHGVIDPVHLYGSGNVRLLDSWLHDNLHYEQDPGWAGKPSHDDGIQVQSGVGIIIQGNRITGAHNASIMVTQDAGIVGDVLVDRNYLDGGGCIINLAQKARGPLQGIAITGNLFGLSSPYNCHVIRPREGTIQTAGNAVTDGRAVRVNYHAS